MASNERSISDVLQDIIHNIQEIVRSEVRLAKTEIKEEARRAKSPSLWMAVGSVGAMFSIAFVLLAMVYALSLVVPNWAAALIVGALLAIVGGVGISGAITRFEQVTAPERTRETLKENVKWLQQPTK